MTVYVSDNKQQLLDYGSGQVFRLGNLLINYLVASVYVFRAERLNADIAQIGHVPDLLSDASNLASVLLQLGTNPTAQALLTTHLRTIFPSIFEVKSQPIEGGNRAQIFVTNRIGRQLDFIPGITVPLSDSGSGVGQVVALLYVALTSLTSKVIVIDEPNSFLHPAAARKLLHILSTLGHQFIVTTHSADVVRAANPDAIHLIRMTEGESIIETLDAESISDMRRILDDVGVRLSDFFGADSILWVEGPTEERCFPLLLDYVGKPLSVGTAVVAIVNTGDLESSHFRASLAWQVYERLSAGTALVPPALAFSLDREGRTEIEIEDMERRSQGRVHFLPRRTYENYLLDSDAVHAVLASSIMGGDSGLTRHSVSEWLHKNGSRRKYFRDGSNCAFGDEAWHSNVNAPALLAELFVELSDAKLEYRKTVHSPELTRWLLANKPKYLSELIAYVTSLITTSN
jgi:hypothetical protein